MLKGMLTDLLDLSHVPRWITFPVARPQSVAEHSFRVAVITYCIWDQMDYWVDSDYLPNLLVWALVHDGPESKTGDLPRPLKKMIGRSQLHILESEVCPWIEQVTPEQKIILRVVELADNIEALSWLTRYGDAFKDKYDGQNVCNKLRNTLQILLNEAEVEWPESGLANAAIRVMEELELSAPIATVSTPSPETSAMEAEPPAAT